MNIQTLLPKLDELANQHKNNSLLFNFDTGSLKIRGVYFALPKTFVLGVSGDNLESAAWQCEVKEDSTVATWIPNEAYSKLCNALIVDGRYSNALFFERLQQALIKVIESKNASSASEQEIMALLSKCTISDKKADPEGHKPFFDHWRRVKPSRESLNKIQRYFGKQVRENCYKNQVTAVWSTEPKGASLSFLEPSKVTIEIENLKM